MCPEAAISTVVDYICSKCQHPNPVESRNCGKCGSRLYLTCRKCRHRNPRTADHCGKCGHRLRRSALRRLTSKLFFRKNKIRAREIVLLCIVLALIYWYIQYVSNSPIAPPMPAQPKD